MSSFVCVTFEYGIFLFEHDQTFVLIIYSISLNVFVVIVKKIDI